MRKSAAVSRFAAFAAVLAGLSLAEPVAANAPLHFAPEGVRPPPAVSADKSYPAILIIPTSKTGQTDETANLDQTICKMGPPPTGSRLGATRECHTVREWEVIRHEQWGQITHFQLMPTQTNFMHDCCEVSPGRPLFGQ